MQKGGTKDFGFCRVSMVHADHPSTWDQGEEKMSRYAGHACGFVINIPHYNFKIYHAGDTNLFSDMRLINAFYKPDVLLLPIGDVLGMGPLQAAYAARHFLPDSKILVPMHFNGAACLTGTT